MPTSSKQSPNLNTRSQEDVAHSPGHKKMNLKDNFSEGTGDKNHAQNSSAENRMSGADIIHRNESPQRRIISGASLGKKGQRNKG